MTAQSLLSSTILKRVMTVFLFVLTQKRVMAPFNDNVLGLVVLVGPNESNVRNKSHVALFRHRRAEMFNSGISYQYQYQPTH